MAPTDLLRFLATGPGGVSLDEGLALSRYAKACINAVIVEIGSFKGKSAVALASGQAQGRFADTGLVYCIEPHQPFVGLYGGRFGPNDRRDFYHTMLEAGVAERVCLINLESGPASRAWDRPIGLLFIDGDHTLEGVRSDVAAWEPHVMTGGTIVFDDAVDTAAGPCHVVADLVDSGRFAPVGTAGKMKALRKIRPGPDAPRRDRKTILVACHEMLAAGGLYRFERFGRVVRQSGHELAFLAFGDDPRRLRGTEFPILTFDDAVSAPWDITIVPGAGFPDATIDRLGDLRGPNFGLRVQHILNDETVKSRFLRVNQTFKPDVVIFNNRHWQPGTFTDLQADAFHILEGAVDSESLAPDPRRGYRSAVRPYVVGGLANKNPAPLVAAVRACRADVHLHLFGEAAGDLAAMASDLLAQGRLRLFGILAESELSDFYADLDCVAHTETFAGWANLAAEGMACGVPVICTPHGTAAFAEAEATALVLADPTADALADAITRLRGDPALASRLAYRARHRIRGFTWTSYAADLLRLMRPPEAKYYTWSPDLKLFGKWPETERLAGLDLLLDGCMGKTILDCGAAEGVVARRFLERGAALVHGFEKEPSSVPLAMGICAAFPQTSFREADLSDWAAFEKAHGRELLDSYDIVLYLGLHHHLPVASRMGVLEGVAKRTSDWLAVRTPADVFAVDAIGTFLEARGFGLVGARPDDIATHLGGCALFRRGLRS